ncbi:MAG: hypothetical protein ABWJ42_05705 [Sulfolobales archaeon]
MSRISLVASYSLARGTVLDGYLGFGSPRVVRDPYTREPKLFFTAWRDVAGQAREVWVAPIVDEENLAIDLRRALRIARGSDFNVTGVNTVDVFYDFYNDQWIVFSTIYGGDPKSIAVSLSDPEFKKIEYTLLQAPVTAGDAGFPCISYEDEKFLSCTGGFGLERSLMIVSDFTSRPLSQPTLLKRSLGGLSLKEAADVHKSFIYDGRFIMLTENLGEEGLWHIQAYFGPRVGLKGFERRALGKWQIAFSQRSPIPYTSEHEKSGYGHPEYTVQLKRPWLLWASFRHCHWAHPDKTLKWAHEIWAAETTTTYFANPREWLPALFEADSNIEPPWTLDTLGASKIMIVAYKPIERYVLTIRLGRDVNKLVGDEGYYAEESYNIERPGRIIIDPAPPAIYVAPSSQKDFRGLLIYLIP